MFVAFSSLMIVPFLLFTYIAPKIGKYYEKLSVMFLGKSYESYECVLLLTQITTDLVTAQNEGILPSSDTVYCSICSSQI